MNTSVSLIIQRPERFAPAHLVIRLLLLIGVSTLAGSHGWPGLFVYMGLPAISGILISEHGGRGYLDRDAPGLIRVLHWLVGLYAYMALLTDRFPTGSDDAIRLEVVPSGEPTVGSAVTRIVTSLPALLALWVLGLLGFFVWIIAAVFVVVSRHYPDGLFDFQCGVLRFHARFLAWHASLTDRYPSSMMEEATGGLQPQDQHP
jgi:hypothetical protein